MKFILCIALFIIGNIVEAQEYRPAFLRFTSQQQQVTMAYIYEKAPGDSNQTIVLLHGKNFSYRYWIKTIALLLQQGYNVLAPDQVGFGNSSIPLNYQYTYQQLAANTKLLIDTLGISRPVLLGHSMGGMLAIRYTLLYPGAVSRLILEDPLGLEDWKRQGVPYTNIDDAYKAELKKDKAALKTYMLNNYFHGEWKASYDTLLNESSLNLGRPAFAWGMALTSDMIYTQPVVYELDLLQTPTTLIIGDKDRTAPGKEKLPAEQAEKLGNYPELGRIAAALIPHCDLVVLEGIGHIPHEEDFGKWKEVLGAALKQ